MDFRKYTSIENSYSQDLIAKIKEEGYAEEVFVVQEKAHGSNLSIWTDDGKNFRTAKRTSFLEKDEPFFNHQLVLDNLKPKLIELWNKLKSDIHISEMVLYGEIIGGNYSHKDIPKTKGAIKVQKGVAYTPNNEFYAFDLLINNESYLAIDKLNELLESLGFLYAKTLFSGNLEAVLNYPNTFQSTISRELGLPEMEDNMCEGVVIKTIKNLRFKNNRRVILKNKNEKWSEKEKRVRKKKKAEPVSAPVQELQEEIARYVTENRLNNVISKVGEVSFKDFGKLMGLFSRDILEDFTKENATKLTALEKSEQKLVTKSINRKATDILRARLKQ